MEKDKLFEQLANKIKINYYKTIEEEQNNIKSDCVIIKNELAKSLDKFNECDNFSKKYYFGEPFDITSHIHNFYNNEKLLNNCDLDVLKYENKLSKLSGLKVKLSLNKSNKLNWQLSVFQ